jgi:hypothetical protein
MVPAKLVPKFAVLSKIELGIRLTLVGTCFEGPSPEKQAHLGPDT